MAARGRKRVPRGRVKLKARGPATLACEGCAREQSVECFSRYLAIAGDLDADTAPAQLCDTCATYGPPAENPLLALPAGEARAIEILAAGGSFRKAAQASGLSVELLKYRLSGATRQASGMREAFRTLLIQAGVDPMRIVRIIREAMDASDRVAVRIGTDENGPTFETHDVPDHAIRLKAVDRAMRALALEERTAYVPKAALQFGAGARGAVIFDTTLGDGKTSAVEEAYQIGSKLVGEGPGERE